MNNKILSICVPSYNMEQYLNRCIDSLLAPEVLDDIEIIIVNDGSKDKTLQIACYYEKQYPKSIIVINKLNGHYGSTVNAAMKIATGKYFRILDADDWVDTKTLILFVNQLKKIDVDCIFTRFKTHDYRRQTVEEQNVEKVIFDQTLSLSHYVVPMTCYAMHSLTYNLEFLRNINYKQTEGICYTDAEYVFYPLREVRTIYCMNVSLYQYYLGREEQSMSFKVLSKNYRHFEILFKQFICNWRINACENVKNIQNYYIISMMTQMLNIHILYMWFDKERDIALRTYIDNIKNLSYNLFTKCLNIKYRGIPYVQIWYKYPKIYKYILFPIKCYFVNKK